MTTTTQVYRFHKYGNPDVLQLDTLPIEDPQSDEVRVRVHSMSLNRADLLWMANTYVEVPALPSRLGYEVAGVVETIGSEVTEFEVGDRVSSIPAFSISDYGSFGETAIVPARGLMKTPESFTPAQASSFAFPYFTGYFALLELAHLQAYQTVVISAATSTTGLAAIHIAKKIGATIIATTRTSQKKQKLIDAGAHYVIATQEEDVTDRIFELTNGKGADVIYDPIVGGGMLEKLLSALKIRGQYIVYGTLDMNLEGFPLWKAFTRSPFFHLYKVFDFTGNRNLGLLGDEEAFARAKHFITAGLSDGSLPTLVDQVFEGIKSLPEAMRFMDENKAKGKIVVTL